MKNKGSDLHLEVNYQYENLDYWEFEHFSLRRRLRLAWLIIKGGNVSIHYLEGKITQYQGGIKYEL